MIEYLVWLFFVSAQIIDGRCSICRAMHLKSTVTPGMCFSTAMACDPGHFNEDGKWVEASRCNTVRCQWNCSNGHVIYVVQGAR